MAYGRIEPRARTGTTGINVEADVTEGNGVFINPPDRVAAVTIAVHITSETGSFTIETSCNRPETLGEDAMGGYWDNVYGDNVTLTENTTVMIANAVTGIRVNCISGAINVAFCG
jgi:hypothetical protein